MTTRRDRSARPAPDLVVRQFVAEGPNALWVADITYVPTWVGFLYLAVVLDVWSRKIVGWAIAAHLRTSLVTSALDMAVTQRSPVDVIHHSDQGCQYTSIEFGKRCREEGIRPSMGSVGDCYDNAMCESFFATLECELIDRSTLNNHLEGRDGNDILTGSQGDDFIFGGDGSDLIIGGRGSDVALMGNDNDTFVWNPGDGSDVVEGQAGFDTMVFNGSNANEQIDLSANGSRLRLFRDVGNVTMDASEVEQINITALGGADTITVNALNGTGVTNVNLDLAFPAGSITGDGQADNIIVNGTNGPVKPKKSHPTTALSSPTPLPAA